MLARLPTEILLMVLEVSSVYVQNGSNGSYSEAG